MLCTLHLANTYLCAYAYLIIHTHFSKLQNINIVNSMHFLAKLFGGIKISPYLCTAKSESRLHLAKRHKHTQPSLGIVYKPQFNPFATLGLTAVLFLSPQHTSSFECFKQKVLKSETVRGRDTKNIVSAQKASCLSRNKHSGTKRSSQTKR